MTAPPTSSVDTIVIALDGSPAAASALPVARALAARLRAHLEILHVAPDPSRAQAPTHRAHERAGGSGSWVWVRSGDPAVEIIRDAEDPAVALVVLATHGGAIADQRRPGSVAERVVAEATHPVLFVRPEAAHEAAEAALRAGPLLLPLYGAPSAIRALGPAVDLARRLRAPLDLLVTASGGEVSDAEPGTVGLPQYVDQPQHAWPEWQRDVIEQFGIATARRPEGLPIRAFAAAGPGAAAILRIASEHRAGIVALVRRSRPDAEHEQILREVLDRATCAVLLVPAEQACGQRPRLRVSWLAGGAGGCPREGRTLRAGRP